MFLIAQATSGNVKSNGNVVKTPLLRIDALMATALTGDRIDLAWHPVPECETYHIFRSGAPNQALAITRDTRLAIRELAPGTKHTFVVSGRDVKGTEQARSEVGGTTLPAGLWVSTANAAAGHG